MGFRDRSIEQKIFLLILPISLVPAAIYLVIAVMGSRVTFEQARGSELSQQARYLTDLFDQFLTARFEEFMPLARGGQWTIETPPTDLEAHGIAAVILVDDAGEIHLLGHVLEDRYFPHYINESLAVFSDIWERRADLPPDGLLTDMQIPIPGWSPPLKLAIFACPGPRESLYAFLVDGKRLMKRFQAGRPQAPETFLVYSRSGFFLFSTETLIEEVGQGVLDGVAQPENMNDWFDLTAREQTYLMAPVESKLLRRKSARAGWGADWVFVLQYDMERFLGPLEALAWLMALIGLGLVLLSVVVARVASRRIVLPLRQLRRQADDLARGQLDVHAQVEARDEIGNLAQAFNRMATRLHSTYGALEERIEENRLRAEHINVINQITNAIIQSFSLENIFEIISRDLSKVFRFDALWITFHEREGKSLKINYIEPAGMISLFKGGSIALAQSLHGQAIEGRETLHAEVGPNHSSPFHDVQTLRSEGFQSFLIAPLPGRDRLIGTMCVASTDPDAYGAEHVAVMTSLAGAVAIAIEQAYLFRRTSHFANELERKVEERTRELELATQKLILTEKYYATGRLAGNLAHEINNPLAIIKNYLQLVRNRVRNAGGGRRESDPSLETLEIIDEEVNRIARLVGQMLDLHRPSEHKVEPLDINNLIEDILALLEEELSRCGIAVERNLDPDLPKPVVSPDLIRQVLINLVRNAQDAMEEGGTLSLATSPITEWGEGRERRSVRIRVADTGVGIAPEHLNRIFDPFFTTKSQEKGTGLGLCVSYSIIRVYHGSIEVESEPGRGTAFVVTLPAGELVATRESPESAALVREIPPGRAPHLGTLSL